MERTGGICCTYVRENWKISPSPGGGGYQPMSFEGGGNEKGKRKRGKILKKGRRGKKKEEMGKKKRKGEVKG